MPNVKIYVDQALPAEAHEALATALVSVRALLAQALGVGPEAFQFAMLTVYAMDDLPPVNVEISILPTPGRTREKIKGVGEDLQRLLSAAAAARVAVRIGLLDPQSYLALK
ncbi:hypothetical protein OE766_13625 [Pararhizobium sp. YC-54]|uniref:hypothetical protein n=1 Tax=Pararhizobium sp. YC-54 TaxID=2986920 RepID=UPI0021F799FA|nr:hypothetical protein [Pararhizobium sp. YC-54]MCV9999290.1 hypothetical protein [Pararhizobium sp. YC-54]